MPYRRFRVKIWWHNFGKVPFSKMIARPDHQRPNYYKMQLEKNNLMFVGARTTTYYYNGNKAAIESEPITIREDQIQDLLSEIQDEILNKGGFIKIEHKEEDWDDIPSPPQEDLEAAIQIMDQIKLPDPIVPIPQKTNLPDWD